MAFCLCAEGSINVPLYQAIDISEGFSFAKVVKLVAFAANGVSPIEVNPSFAEEAKKVRGVVGRKRGEGGALHPSREGGGEVMHPFKQSCTV